MQKKITNLWNWYKQSASFIHNNWNTHKSIMGSMWLPNKKTVA